MFNDFIKWSNGRTTTKVLATLLVLTLMFSNFAILGSVISYAIDDIKDNSTSIENVKFDVYVKEPGNREISADFNDETIEIGMSVKVENGGVLKNSTLVLEDTNFNALDNETEFKLGNIQSGQEITKKINIVSKKDQEYNLGLLSMLSKIRLTGEYTNNKGKEIHVDEIKNVKINWNAQNITEENNPIMLEQSIITNNLFNIDGQEKRVIQLEVKSGIENNIYPIKNTKIELNKLNLPNNDKPEKVVVASFGTEATNGDNGLNFNSDFYKYDEEQEKLTINLVNTENNNKINWSKNAQDRLIVTFVYDKDTNVDSIESIINNEINVYEANEAKAKLTKKSEIKVDGMPNQGNTITGKTVADSEIYNSKMKLGQEPLFNVNYVLEIGYAKTANRITISNESEKVGNIYYKNTTINKNELVKVLGAEGTLEVSYLNEEGQKQEIAVLNNASEADENGNIVINYNENYSELTFEVLNPASEGKVNIKNIKEIQVNDLTQEQIENIKEINTTALFKAFENETEVLNENKNSVIAVKNPTTEVELGIANSKLSTTQNNNMDLTVTLKNNNVKYDLYLNPVVTVKLPEEIEKIEVTEKPTLLNANGLEVESYNVENNTIKIVLKGEQKDYIESNTQLLININAKTKKLIPTLERNIVIECVNSKETVYDQENTYAQSNVLVELVAEEGILLANSVSGYDDNSEEILAFRNEEKNVNLVNKEVTIKGVAINNTSKDLNDVVIIGKINGKLMSPISIENAQVYYTQDAEVSNDSNFEAEFAENVTGYKLVCNLSDKQIIEFTYKMEVASEEEKVNYSVFNDGEETKSPNLVLKAQKDEVVEQPAKNEELLSLNVNSIPETTEILKPGQEVVLNINIVNLKESYEEEVQEEENFIDVLDNEETVIEETNNEYTEIKGDSIVFEGNLSEGLVAKEAKVIVGEKEEKVELNSNSTFTIEQKVEPQGTMSIELKLLVGEEIDKNEAISNLSAKVRTKNETGEIEKESFAGEVKNIVTYSVDKPEILKDIIVSKKIDLNLEETKKVEIKTEPENISLDKLEIKSEDENIAIIEDGFNVKAVSTGTTNLIVSEKEGTLSKKIEIVVIDPNNTEKENDVKLDEDEEESTINPEEQNKKQTYTISGFAWLDENEDGKIEEKEKLLPGIVVKLKNNTTGEYVKYKTGELMAIITDAKGEYKFTELEPGNYTVEFDYDKNKYKVTSKTDSESVAHTVTTEGKTIITTDTLKLEDKDIRNVNIGLVLNKEYDLELNKYITKVTLQNSNGTETYSYDKTNLAKVEVGAKYLNGTTVIVEYVIQVTNKGEIPAYAKTIVDYVSPEYTFNSEMNTNWYQAQDKNLYNKELADKIIQPGETKEVKLVLTKVMTASNAGLVNNSAEIYEDFNEYAIADKNSTPANKIEKENDYSSADIIISLKTGGPALYIGIIVISMVALGAGIYVINKKIIKGTNN